VSRILVLGGYGGFGARISLRLVQAGYEVLVAGRSADKAAHFCQGIPGLIPLALDRADIAAALAEERPALVVDASGPFQAMDYTVPRACIAAAVPYCDIADGRDFVCGIAALDEEARAAGVAIVSGASSVPALSGAVIHQLTKGLDRVRAIDMAISASNRATAGEAVSRAILGQVGHAMRLMRGGRWQTVFGWQEIGRQSFSVSGQPPISGRWVALADVPDLALLPDRLPGRPNVRFRAGTELAFQNLTLWLASWLVRWGMLRSLDRAGAWLRPLQGLTARLGSDRSAMILRLFGDREGETVERRWTLIANRGDGPEIPALSVPPLVAHMLAGREMAGARDAGSSLTLADYAPAFAELAIAHAVEEFPLPLPLYRRVMGPVFDRLPPAVRAMHDVCRDGGAAGQGEVLGAANALGRMVARVMRFPPPGDHPLHVGFSEKDGVECWTRDFGGHRFSSRLSQQGRHLVERFGPLRFRFELTGDANGLKMAMAGWSAFGVPLPLMLAPKSDAREWEEDGRFHFDVPVSLPLIGRVVHYRGWLEPLLGEAGS